MVATMRIDAYAARVGLTARPSPDSETLRALHAAHRETFLFENLTIQAGGASASRCAISSRNSWTRAAAATASSTTRCLPRRCASSASTATRCSAASAAGRRTAGAARTWCCASRSTATSWLADVGFGAIGLLEPIPLADGATAAQGGLAYRLRRERELWILSRATPPAETDLYEFTEDPQTPWDVEVANHFTVDASGVGVQEDVDHSADRAATSGRSCAATC